MNFISINSGGIISLGNSYGIQPNQRYQVYDYIFKTDKRTGQGQIIYYQILAPIGKRILVHYSFVESNHDNLYD